MPGGNRLPRRRRWSSRCHQCGAKIADEGDAVDCVLKPAGVGIQTEATPPICARERRIGRSRLRLNAEGIPYVLDSEDEAVDMELEADGVGVAADGADGGPVDQDISAKRPSVDGITIEDPPRKGPLSVATPASEDLHQEGHQLVAQVGSAEVPSDKPVLVAADEASEMNLTPEVAARLKEVLSNIDPIYHGVFVSMYKLLLLIRNSKVEIKFVMYIWTIKVETMHVFLHHV